MKYLTIGILVFLSSTLFAQKTESERGSFRDRLFFGGDIALGISNNNTVAGASPFVGYRFNDKLSAGLGIMAYYYSTNYYGTRYSSSIYGGNVFSRYLIIENLFAHTEFQIVNTDTYEYDTNTETLSKVRVNVPLWYVGGGYRSPLGGSSFAQIVILYDLIQDPNSPYGSPLSIRGGIIFGI